ncbi:MAG: UDP-N-acetylglucosamine 2-epimerase (non-hydrolyzing) [Maricaulis sp.]|nr:UDP-N-acetylglucosamine 2-epimerase (non-hydrolyzing) [Maricaulis sp.]
MIHVLAVVGTRPEAIKMAPLIRELKQQSWVKCTVALTAQHRDLLDRALAAFDVKGDIDLDLMRPNQSLGEITGRAFAGLDSVLRDMKPDIVLAQGDTTTVMVTALTSFYQNIPFGHVEAGLRTGDLRNPFPEEMNRVFAGKVAALHFAPTAQSAGALLSEGIDPATVHLTGNTVIDALLHMRKEAAALKLELPEGARLVLMTSHRRENFGAPMSEAFGAVRQLVEDREDLHVLFPVHPNPNVKEQVDRHLRGHPRIHLSDPLDYEEFTAAMDRADLILTDSGGVQEEAPALGKPVLVMRRETERPEAVEFGVVKLIGTDANAIRDWVGRLLDNPDDYAGMSRGVSPYGDGLAARRIVQAVADHFGVETGQDRLDSFDPERAARA